MEAFILILYLVLTMMNQLRQIQLTKLVKSTFILEYFISKFIACFLLICLSGSNTLTV